MVCLNVVRFASRTAPAVLAAVLTFSAAAQTADFSKRLAEGQQLRSGDRYAEARSTYQALLRDLQKEGSHPRLEALVLDSMAMNEQDSGDYGAAEIAFNRGMAAFHPEGANDPILIALRSHLSELYIAQGRPEDAEPLLRASIGAMRASVISDHSALSVASEDLAVVCIMRHKYAEAEALLRESQTLIEKAHGADDPRLSTGLLTYAGLMTAQRKHAEAVPLAERAWRLISSAKAVSKSYLASAKSVLAGVYYHVGRYDEAADAARQSIDLAEESLGPNHPRLGLYLSNYAVILKATGQKEYARVIEKKAKAINDQYPTGAAGGATVNVASLR